MKSDSYSLAAVLRNFNMPLEVLEVKLPSLEPKQVMIRVISASICGSQVSEWLGQRDNSKWLPHLLGHEGFGEIVGIGSGVEHFEIGELVVISWISNGLSASPPAMYTTRHGEKINAGRSAVFAQKVIVSQDKLFKIPKSDFGFSPNIASLFGCALPTGAGMVSQLLDVHPDAKILLRGLGGVGMSAAIALSQISPGHKYANDLSEIKLEIAQRLGFTSITSSKLEKDSFDAVLDCTGSLKSLQESFSLLNNRGKLVFATHPPLGSVLEVDPYRLIEGRQIIGTWGGGIKSQADFEKVTGRLWQIDGIRYLVGPSFELEDINSAMEYSLKPDLGRATITM